MDVTKSKSTPRIGLTKVAVMIRRTISILIILFLVSCNDSERKHAQDLVVFESDTRNNVKEFKPTTSQIQAEQELQSSLVDSSKHNLIHNNTAIIKDSVTAINVAEPILFSIYGKENIINQRPYEIYFKDNYWLIEGTLPSGMKGGTFSIIIDARDSKVIRITHGK
jgi:hypothetical protein